MPEIRKGDTVLVLSGRDAGKRGKVEHVVRRDPSPTPVRSGYRRTSLKGGIFVVVEGLNISRKHTKPRQRSPGRPGLDADGRSRRHPGPSPMPLPVERVMVVCGTAIARPGSGIATLDNGAASGSASHCGEPIEVKS